MDSKPSPGDLRAPTGDERMIPSLLSEGVIRFPYQLLIRILPTRQLEVDAASLVE